MTELRRHSAGRFSGALWGILVAACGGLMVASFSGFDVDFELATIFALCGIGLWLLLTALFASGAKSRRGTLAPAPTATQSTAPDAQSGNS
jgi:apolipoprotein N-acyltransferase